jgi:hypothetical protein
MSPFPARGSPAQESRPADAAEVAARVKHYRDEAAARHAQADRELWLRQVARRTGGATGEGAEAFPPAAEAARARLRQEALALLRAEVTAQAKKLSSASPAEATAAREVLEALGGFPALVRVNNPAALANLPEPERRLWQAFWQEVDGLLRGPVPER